MATSNTIPLRTDRGIKLLRAIHARRRQLGLADEQYRAVIERATGKRSCRDLGTVGLGAVLAELGELRPADALPALPASSKLRALWISAWHLGVVQDRRDSALSAFVRRETGIDNAGWATSRDLGTAIDRLKAWMSREAGVVWPKSSVRQFDRARAEALAVHEAQCRLLGRQVPDVLDRYSRIEAINLCIAKLGALVREREET